MIEEHVDPTAETHAQVANLLRTLVTAAAGIAEKAAQRREAEQRAAARRSDVARHAYEERIRAEREIAYLVYRNVERDRWWERATPKDIAGTVEAAGTWASTDPRARAALDRIREELRHRYGFNLEDGATPIDVLDRVEEARLATQGEGQDPPQHAIGPRMEPWEQEMLEAAGEDLGRQVIASEGWPQLQARLDRLQATDDDVHGRLRNALAERELETAVDKGITLVWRLKPHPQARSSAGATQHPPKRPPTPRRRPRPESVPERYAKKKMAAEHHHDNGPDSAAGR